MSTTTKSNVVLYEKVKADLIDRLSSPDFDDSESIGSERDLIGVYGVSRITIRRALSDLEQEGLIYRIPGKGTFRQAKPKNPVTNLMTVFIDSRVYKDEFSSEVYSGIVREAHRLGYHVMAGLAGPDPHSVDMARRRLSEYPAAVHFLMVRNPKQFIEDTGIDPDQAIIVEDQVEFGGKPLMSIVADNVQGSSAVTRHLIELGHRKVGFLTDTIGSVSSTSFRQRCEGWRITMREAGFDAPPSLELQYVVPGEPDGTSALREVERQSLTALFCANDLLAEKITTHLDNIGLSVPQDISIAGFDDIEMAEHYGLTTVIMPMRLIGEVAVKRAVNRLNGTDFGPACTVLPLEMVVRSSTAPPRAPSC